MERFEPPDPACGDVLRKRAIARAAHGRLAREEGEVPQSTVDKGAL